MNNVDLNVNNYNFNDLLNVFKISNIYDFDVNNKKIKKKLETANNCNNKDISSFYLKSSKIIDCIYKLYEKNVILNLDDEKSIEMYKNKIVDIDFFEERDTNKIINVDLNVKVNNNNPTYANIADIKYNEVLNTPNYDIGKPNPNLNNKDNTNLVANTFPNKIAPGNLNSIKRIVQQQNLNLNSCFRDNYYNSSSSNFTYMIPSEMKNVVSLRLASIEIPNSWYLFSKKKGNNIFKIVATIDNIDTVFDITIPDGNYDNDSLTYYLNKTYFYDSGIDNLLKYIKFSIDNVNFKSKFEIIDIPPPNYTISLYFVDNINQNMMNTTGWILGFRMAKYINISDFIMSEGLFDGSGDRYIYFSLNDYQYNNNNSNIICFDKSLNENDILAKIPLTNGKLSLIINDNDNPLTKTRNYNGPINLNKLQIQILDKFGEIIDLNNMDFSFTLELEILYECFNFKDVFS